MMILVTGATGKVGSELVKLLVAAGEKVRAMVHDPRKAGALGGGVEVVQGDLDRPETLATALQGIDKVFLLAAGGDVPGEERHLIDEAKKAGVKHVVMLSSLGVEWDMVGSGLMHAPGEQYLRASGLTWTILRPSEFMSNAIMWRDTIKAQGAIFLPTGSGKHPLIHPRDIAAVAAKVLTTPGHEGKLYSLTGGEALSTAECASKLGTVLGKPVQHVPIPDSAFREQMAKYGAPPDMVDAVARFYAKFSSGQIEGVLPGVEQLTGRKPLTFDTWVKENASAFA